MTPDEILAQHGPREAMEYDVAIVGAGPAGLATAIRLKQLAAERSHEISVVVLEKGSEPGAHILSGAIMDPRAITELIPDWKESGAPLNQPVTARQVLLLDRDRRDGNAARPAARLLPATKATTSSASATSCRWLATQAEALGVEIFPASRAAEVLYDEDGSRARRRHRQPGHRQGRRADRRTSSSAWSCTPSTRSSPKARAASLGRQLIARFKLDEGRDPQSYGIGLKELWEVKPERAEPGLALHTAGWPLDTSTYGGSFLYHLDRQPGHARLRRRPRLHESLPEPVRGIPALEDAPGDQKTSRGRQAPRLRRARDHRRRHPAACRRPCSRAVLSSAARPATSTRAGSRAAMRRSSPACSPPRRRSTRLVAGRQHDELAAYPAAFEKSWLRAELDKSRNFKQWFKKGLLVAALMTGIEQWLLPRLGINSPPWTIHRTEGRSPLPAAGRRVQADRVPEARRRAHLRSPVERLRQQHQPCRGPAGAPDAEGCERAGGRSTWRSTPARRAATARPAVYEFVERRRHRAAADQRAELRPLQDLRHQGPDAEHRLGHAEGGGGPNYVGM